VPPDYFDPVIDAYKKDVDRTLLRERRWARTGGSFKLQIIFTNTHPVALACC